MEGNAWVQVSGGDPEFPDMQVLAMSVSPSFDYGFAFANGIGLSKEVCIFYAIPVYSIPGSRDPGIASCLFPGF